MEIKEYREYCEDEILRLYASVGWTAYTEQPEALRRGFDRSLLTLAAYEGAELLGLIRVVGDGQTIVFVQDLLVFPEYQRKGAASRRFEAVRKRAADHACNGRYAENQSLLPLHGLPRAVRDRLLRVYAGLKLYKTCPEARSASKQQSCPQTQNAGQITRHS